MATFHDAVREALEQAERGAAGGDAGQVITAQFVPVMGISRQMATELIATMATMRAGGGGTDIRKFPLTKACGTEKTPSFSGNQSEFADWTKRVEIFRDAGPEMQQMLKEHQDGVPAREGERRDPQQAPVEVREAGR